MIYISFEAAPGYEFSSIKGAKYDDGAIILSVLHLIMVIFQYHTLKEAKEKWDLKDEWDRVHQGNPRAGEFKLPSWHMLRFKGSILWTCVRSTLVLTFASHWSFHINLKRNLSGSIAIWNNSHLLFVTAPAVRVTASAVRAARTSPQRLCVCNLSPGRSGPAHHAASAGVSTAV
jgi:hypothetical protein